MFISSQIWYSFTWLKPFSQNPDKFSSVLISNGHHYSQPLQFDGTTWLPLAGGIWRLWTLHSRFPCWGILLRWGENGASRSIHGHFPWDNVRDDRSSQSIVTNELMNVKELWNHKVYLVIRNLHSKGIKFPLFWVDALISGFLCYCCLFL